MKPGCSLKQRLAGNEPSIGGWMTIGHPAIAEILARAGFDWIVIDLEHSMIGLETAEGLIRAVEAAGASPLVRLTANDPLQAKRVMDAGAHGVIVPMINTAKDAERAAKMVRYPPAGTRGAGIARAQQYSQTGFRDYADRINDEVIVIAQIEHRDAIDNLEAILAVPGLDGTIIGPYDLSASFGMPGKYNERVVAAALERYESVCRAANAPMGYHVVEPTAEALNLRLGKGYRFLAFSTDFLFLGETARQQFALRSTKS